MQKGTSEKRFRLILWSGSNRVVTSMHSKHRYIKRKKENYRYVLWMSFIILWMIMNTLTRAKSFILESFFLFWSLCTRESPWPKTAHVSMSASNIDATKIHSASLEYFMDSLKDLIYSMFYFLLWTIQCQYLMVASDLSSKVNRP